MRFCFLLQSECPDFDSCIQIDIDEKKPATICKIDHSQFPQILQMTYFCGAAKVCMDGGNSIVLQRAKFNVENYYSLVGMANDLRRSFELLEVLLPAFFSGANSIFKEELRFNTNSHPPIKNTTMKALLNIPAIQGELEFYSFTQQKFEQLYKKFVMSSPS